MLESALYIVPTPIGNLEDITLRAMAVLKEVSLIAAEDTRHSKILLDHLGVSKARLISCYDQVEQERSDLIIAEIRQGGSVALISDAGSPLINDPGYRVVTLCREAGVKIIPLPGPCALITALEGAGQPTSSFMFKGFLPVKQQELEQCLETLKNADYTTVFYESPKRILNSCRLLGQILPERSVSLCRELTKSFESIYCMPAWQLADFLQADTVRCKGEFVVVIGPNQSQDRQIPEHIINCLTQLLVTTPVKLATQVVSELSGIPRNLLYEQALRIKNHSKEAL